MFNDSTPSAGGGKSVSLLPVENLVGECRECPTPGYVVYRGRVLPDGWEGQRRIVKVDCKRRRCRYCGPKHWKPYVQARICSGWGARGRKNVNQVDYDDDRFLLLTAPGDAGEDWNAQAPKAWAKFWKAWKETFPRARRSRMKYTKVAERQLRGAIHYHVIVRGVGHVNIEQLRECATAAGFGSWVGVRRIEARKGGLKGAISYMSKYLLKAADEWDEKQHVMTHSQDWSEGWQKRRGPTGLWEYCLRAGDAEKTRRVYDAYAAVGAVPIGGWADDT